MDVTIKRPCPVDLDARGVDRSGLSFRCDHCELDVHVLSNMTRRTAEDFLAANRGKDLCVSYRRTAEGRILFADDPPDLGAPAAEDEHEDQAAPPPAPLIPVARLRRLGGVPRAAGVSLLLAACTPHGASEPTPDEDAIEVLARDPAPAPAPAALPAPIVEHEIVEGKMAMDDAIPCDKTPATGTPVKQPAERTPPPKRPKIEVVDGGI
ncbi:MAG: hypothetical protein H6711_16655 [Myxococcales bacterium]|nr:hypothetical protein [Myxococcales bacterium]